MKLKPGGHIYFMGIGGTGMASVAGLCQEVGFKVSGSDAGIYPPTSNMLEELKIPISVPYDPKNLDKNRPDLIVVANVLSKNHPEIARAVELNIPLTSFPALMGEAFLEKACSIVVSGTHGKTTTSTMAAYILKALSENPGYLIGGVPKDLPRSFHSGKPGGFFVIEGDEYDTAYFDKNSKFLHYRPKYLIFNNLEFDHADIFKDLAAIEAQFEKLFALVSSPANIIANVSDSGVRTLLTRLGLIGKVTAVATNGNDHAALELSHLQTKIEIWSGRFTGPHLGQVDFSTAMSGQHNLANFAQVLALLDCLVRDKKIKKPDLKVVTRAIADFHGVTRRLEKLADCNGITVYEDFAHHPTAIQKVLQGYRQSFPNRRLIVAFEPRNATARRNVFMKEFASSLAIADQVLIGECPSDQRIPAENRMDTDKLRQAVGAKAQAFATNQDLLNYAYQHLHEGDAIIFMSSGSFSGVQHELKNRLSCNRAS